MGKTDRIIRAVLGVLLVGNVFVALLQHPIAWIGVVLLETAIFSNCPLYLPAQHQCATYGGNHKPEKLRSDI
jgi:hypothetical protein